LTGDRKLSSKSGKKINKSVKCLVSELGIWFTKSINN
jgi:hypothetical protein